jgi:hypothetical protein
VSWERQSDGRFHGGRRRVDDAHESGLGHFGICHGLRDYDGGILPYFFSILNVAELVDDIGCTDGTVLEGATVETLQRLLSAVGALHVSRRTWASATSPADCEALAVARINSTMRRKVCIGSLSSPLGRLFGILLDRIAGVKSSLNLDALRGHRLVDYGNARF